MMRHRIASLVETALRAASAAQEITSPSIPAVAIGVLKELSKQVSRRQELYAVRLAP